MSVGKYSIAADVIGPKHGTSVSIKGAIVKRAGSSFTITAVAGPASSPSTLTLDVRVATDGKDLCTIYLPDFSFVGNGSTISFDTTAAQFPAPMTPTFFSCWITGSLYMELTNAANLLIVGAANATTYNISHRVFIYRTL